MENAGKKCYAVTGKEGPAEMNGWKKKWVLAAMGILVLMAAGCGGKAQEDGASPDGEYFAALYRNIYDEASGTGTLNDLETVRGIVERLGENGYAAVDQGNQIDMTNPEQALHFCQAADEEREADLTVIVVAANGGFIKYDFHTVQGEVNIVRGYYQYEGGSLENRSTVSYPADFWQYTEEGYLLFEGSYYSEDHYAVSLSDEPEHVALRVQPLDETCRELNRRYILQAGYGGNNMFLVDWTEEDFGDLDFYDLFDRFYPHIYQRPVPYAAADDLSVEAVYRIPAGTFETVIGKYLEIDSEKLRKGTTYFKEDGTYEYRPRGFDEGLYPDIPCPEVVSCAEHGDGTIELTVNAVYSKENTSKAFTHKTVIRPLSDGSFQYVSNRLVFPDGGYDTWWYSGRQSGARQGAAALQDSSQEAGGLIGGAKKEELEREALSAAEKAEEVYADAVGELFSGEKRKRVVSLLGEAGYVSITDGVNMENPDGVRDFYTAYEEGRDARVTVFDVGRDGLIGAYTFLHGGGRLQACYFQVGWSKEGIPEIISWAVDDIAEIKLTEKGYFIYAYEVMPYHSGLRQYWRVSPLSDRCRELTEKYVAGLSYINYNVLVTDWDDSNVEDILMPCMFEDIYRIDTGKELRPENGEIPAKDYEGIMTAYFPATVEQIREACGYQEDTDSYPYEMIFPGQYPPFAEVTDYTENPDGTLTLSVDGVWPDYNSDCAFVNRITVRPFDDGTFRYLSNAIEKREMDIPVVTNPI